ncbi:MAG: DNA replication and repair protein RecF [Candidatus Latescibacteria bacterium]|nr:DNA replication and repair protein RecF [Candidatus Latescibacterota bacterium]NIM22665.1 DNA replication and repair protein RecF [Candidatus Latescibacterota bacterium]NIM64954.1 DNA replication and repair protein RecF [Candidatus Latescibacterota bacterium]NIO01469.1 DNA replication and repair protein RecF [Candidatus Latescibacterota bacterium]NIO27979.1 DNA replication and repair protein RecF [Candidatus Latescibacterota bacterium]
MLIETLSSTYFRNLASQTISFSPGVNLLVGENGQGKTNVLEAIYLFKFGRSFRTRRDSDMIRFGEDFCRVEIWSALERGDSEQFSLAVEASGAKQAKVSGKAISKFSELVGKYPCVLFGPQDLMLANGPPEERRRFIDMTGSMTDRSYLELLKGYRRALQQRNAALKLAAIPEERSLWDRELVEKGCALTERRTRVVEQIVRHVKRHSSTLSHLFEFSLDYKSSFMDESMAATDAREAFSMKLASMEEEEARRGVTLVGPHRDDVFLLEGGKDLKRFGSQGQKRLLAVLMKLAELSFLEAELEEPCVLLLDDVFSEFDATIGKRLMQLLNDGRQVFVTSPSQLEWKDARFMKKFRVEAGTLGA